MTHWLVMGSRALCIGATNTNLPWEENAIKIVTMDQLLCNPHSLSTLTLHSLHLYTEHSPHLPWAFIRGAERSHL